MKYSKQIKKLLSSVLLFIVIFIAASIWSTRNHVSGPAPQFSLSNLDNLPHDFKFSNNEKPLIVHFFATWCPICELENDSIKSISKDHQVIMVAMQSGDNEAVNDYKQKHQLDMPIYNDESGEVSRLYGVKGVPTSFIIDNSGNIFSSTIGYATEIGLRLRLWSASF